MFDLKLRRIANDLFHETLSSNPLDTLRLLAYLAERTNGVLTGDQIETLTNAIGKAYDEGVEYMFKDAKAA